MLPILATFEDPTAIVKAVPRQREWSGEWASQSPLNQFEIVVDGHGANGSAGYLALTGDNSDQFYVESTPYWWPTATEFDLRDTRTTFYLRELAPLRVADGYDLYLFIDNHRPAESATNYGHCGWFLHTPLAVGADEWVLNDVLLANDEAQWTRYSGDRSLDHVLGHCGFIGVMYLRGTAFRGVHAMGVLGLDEFKYGLK